jgi:hypothetical protein
MKRKSHLDNYRTVDRFFDECLKLENNLHALHGNRPYDFREMSHEKASLSLYAVENNPANLARLRGHLDAIGISYKLIVLDPTEEFTNIKLLDIGL